jgi:hypothetical protein
VHCDIHGPDELLCNLCQLMSVLFHVCGLHRSLDGTKIGDAGAVALVKALESNNSVTTI